jgi:hypothetical protein
MLAALSRRLSRAGTHDRIVTLLVMFSALRLRAYRDRG